MVISTNSIWGLREMERDSTENYVEWATQLLVSGCDSRHLRILAGLEQTASSFEAREYFQKTVQELNLQRPTREMAIRAYSVELARQLVEKQINVRKGVKMLFQLCVECDYPRFLNIWFNLDDALDAIDYGDEPWTYPGLTKENATDTVISIAKVFIEENGDH